MTRGKAEDAGGLTPAKDDNAALCHFDHRTLPILKCVGYNIFGEDETQPRTAPAQLFSKTRTETIDKGSFSTI